MGYEQELRKQTELMRRSAQTVRVNHLYGRGKNKGFAIGAGDLSKLTKEDWEEHRRILHTEGAEEARKFIDKKSGAMPTFLPVVIFFVGLFLASQAYAWYLLTFYGG